MTIDTQKTAYAVARIMELDARRTPGERLPMPSEETARDKAFIAESLTMVTTIRDLLDVVSTQNAALTAAKNLILQLSKKWSREDLPLPRYIDDTLTLAAPLMKLKGEV